jgi:hypothetical protein
MSGLPSRSAISIIGPVESEPVVHREEVTVMLFAIADINANARVFRELLEEDPGGEEEFPEADA